MLPTWGYGKEGFIFALSFCLGILVKKLDIFRKENNEAVYQS